MKINRFLTVIVLLFAVLIAYGLYALCRNEALQWPICIAGGISVFLTCAGALAVSVESSRATVNLRVVSGIAAVIMIALQFLFTFRAASLTAYILTTGVLLFLWIIAAYAIGHTSQKS